MSILNIQKMLLSQQAMKLKDCHPELRSRLRFIPVNRMYNRFGLFILRRLLSLVFLISRTSKNVTYEDRSLINAGVRIYRPKIKTTSKIGVIWIHGGGMVSGNNTMDNRMCSRYVEELGAVVFSVDYRLAPENPFPAGIDDCFEVWQWIQRNAEDFDICQQAIIIAGQSGGGGLAASLAHRIFEFGGPQPIAQLLFCPMLDDQTARNRELDAIQHIGWNNRNNRAAWNWYFSTDSLDLKRPKNSVAARRNDLRGLPPTWLGIGDIDLFYEETRLYAVRLKKAGVDVIFDVVPMAPHGFEVFAPETELTKNYLARHFDSLRTLLVNTGKLQSANL